VASIGAENSEIFFLPREEKSNIMRVVFPCDVGEGEGGFDPTV